ncbi:MAG: helix-turn-helix domain-containing protein [Desulfovibrio sp.]|nr:helix-turn-helix domain-containing protein [Desulfovibrio sp.]
MCYRRLGISAGSLSAYENGREPTSRILSQISQKIGFPLEIDAQGDLVELVRIVGRCVWSCREW